jgi:L-fuculose-phosphate aldolase
MSDPRSTPTWQLRRQMCDIGHRIWQRGYCNGNEGNHSVRIGENRVLCTPTGISKGFLEPEDMCVVDLEGNQVESNPRGRKRTSEVLVHLSVYKHRSDVQAVIHSHPPHAVAFCIAGMPLPEGIHPEAEVFLGKVPVAEYATPGTPELPQSIVPKIGPETNTSLMGNHGSVSFAETLYEAYYKLEILDGYCRQLLLARQLGQVNTLTKQQMSDLLQVKQRFGLSDERAACVETGCVGDENDAFLAGFDARPMGMRCAADGTPAGGGERGNAAGAEDGDFEALVQAITDRIMQERE